MFNSMYILLLFVVQGWTFWFICVFASSIFFCRKNFLIVTRESIEAIEYRPSVYIVELAFHTKKNSLFRVKHRIVNTSLIISSIWWELNNKLIWKCNFCSPAFALILNWQLALLSLEVRDIVSFGIVYWAVGVAVNCKLFSAFSFSCLFHSLEVLILRSYLLLGDSHEWKISGFFFHQYFLFGGNWNHRTIWMLKFPIDLICSDFVRLFRECQKIYFW